MRLHIGLVATLAVVLIVVPLAAVARQPTKVYRIGWLSPGSRPSEPGPVLVAFLQALREFGYVEGQNLVVEYRYAEHQLDRLPSLAAALVGLQPDVIVTTGTPAIRALQQATSTIPIVVGSGGDLARQGIVASLARPSGNITGLTLLGGLDSKRLELLTEAVPTATRVALLINPANPGTGNLCPAVEASGRALRVHVQCVEAPHPDALDAAFHAIVTGRAEALLLSDDFMVSSQATRIAAFALEHRLPTMGVGQFAQAGGLLAYSADFTDMFRRAAAYVDKILKGAKPADLPVERADKLFLVVNLKTAKALGIPIPSHLLMLADEVLQ